MVHRVPARQNQSPWELGALLEACPQNSHGIVVVMDIKEAQNTLNDHIRTIQ